jgi:cytochrome c biogenesis protein CcmG/thiol:disulfide interchange protein DsbE
VAEISAGEVGQGAERAVAPPAWRQHRWLLPLVAGALLALFLLLYYGLRNGPNVPVGGAVALDRPAPDFAVTTLEGRPVRLDELRGQVVVLNLWASWCVPCRQEAVELNRSYDRYKDRGVAFVGIAWNDDEGEARKFARQYRVEYPLALDVEGRLAIAYGMTGVPETFLVDREGRLTMKTISAALTQRLKCRPAPWRTRSVSAGSAIRRNCGLRISSA